VWLYMSSATISGGVSASGCGCGSMSMRHIKHDAFDSRAPPWTRQPRLSSHHSQPLHARVTLQCVYIHENLSLFTHARSLPQYLG
jgi:hypothetical protein